MRLLCLPEPNQDEFFCLWLPRSLQAAEAGGAGAQRDVSSARLHLRGLLKQAQERYGEIQPYRQLQDLLAKVEAAQEQLAPK